MHELGDEGYQAPPPIKGQIGGQKLSPERQAALDELYLRMRVEHGRILEKERAETRAAEMAVQILRERGHHLKKVLYQ